MEHGHDNDAQAVYQKALSENPQDLTVLNALVKVCETLAQPDKALFYRGQHERLQAEVYQYRPQTIRNYRQVIAMTQARGADLIVMQYPLRKIDALKEVLGPSEKIIFVENVANFEEALKSAEYSELFIDRFAGNFGHCTGAGNRLLAENLAEVILKKLGTVP